MHGIKNVLQETSCLPTVPCPFLTKNDETHLIHVLDRTTSYPMWEMTVVHIETNFRRLSPFIQYVSKKNHASSGPQKNHRLLIPELENHTLVFG